MDERQEPFEGRAPSCCRRSIGKFRGVKLIARAGGFDGIHSHLALYPTETVTIVLLSGEQPAIQKKVKNRTHPLPQRQASPGEESILNAPEWCELLCRL